MNDKTTEATHTSPDADSGSTDPVQTIREGAVAASIWLRQSPTGSMYFDFSLSRSWKSVSTEKAGYSRNYFARNRAAILSVVDKACDWIEREEAKLEQDRGAEAQAA